MIFNILNPYRFVNTEFPANLFIGGVGATSVTSASDLAALTTLDVSDISYFTVDGNNNVKCLVEVDFNLLANAFYNDTDLTYFVDIDGHLDQILAGSFRGIPNCKTLVAINSRTNVSSYTLRDSGIYTYLTDRSFSVIANFQMAYFSSVKYLRMTNVGNLSAYAGMRNLNAILRFYIPSATTFSATDYDGAGEVFYLIKTGCIIYVNSSYDGGTLPHALDYAVTSRSATLVYVNDFTAPNAVSDLSASNITSSGCDLNFTAPSSTNALDFYEVWIENIDLDEWHKDRVVGRYNINQEITATGDTITGLTTGTNYKIWIVACDEFWNRSAISNEITITTL